MLGSREVIELTPVAAERLAALRADTCADGFLRVYVAGNSCCGPQYGLAFDESTAAGDTVTELSGIPVAVDPSSLPYVEGATIDFVDALMGGGFRVTNERQGGGCACGRR